MKNMKDMLPLLTYVLVRETKVAELTTPDGLVMPTADIQGNTTLPVAQGRVLRISNEMIADNGNTIDVKEGEIVAYPVKGAVGIDKMDPTLKVVPYERLLGRWED